MTRFVCAGGGFLLAVLWFDLMFDVQALHPQVGTGPEAAVASIAGYYRRVTNEARPMNLLVAGAMAWTLAAIVAQIFRGDAPVWVEASSLALAGTAVGLAATRTVPAAVRLGQQADPPARQHQVARSIGRDHLVCLTAIAMLLVIQLGWA